MAAGGTRVEIKGADELARGARKLADEIGSAAGDAGRLVGNEVASNTRGSVPRLTGRLAASVMSRAEDTRVEMSMGEGLAYAGWIEYGGSRGRPLVPEGRYLVGPAESKFDDYVRRVGDATNKTIGGFTWPTPT